MRDDSILCSFVCLCRSAPGRFSHGQHPSCQISWPTDSQVYICLVVQGGGVGIPADRLVLGGLKLLDLLRGQGKVVDLGVLPDPLGRDALRQGDVALVQGPADEHLGLGLAVLVGQLLEHRLAPALAAHQGAVGLDGDAPLLAPLGDVVAGAPGVDLPLADAQHAALARAAPLGLKLLDVLLELVEVVHAVVGDADVADLALLDALDQAAPRLLARLGAAVGGVQEHQVDVVEPSDLEGLVDLGLGVLVGQGPARHLGGEEDLVARGCGRDLADGGTTTGLIFVDSRRVDLLGPGKQGVSEPRARDSLVRGQRTCR
ncbi:hypothetical protein FJTKL_12151 [Diaporthe vaccinii]|uniref:Uncharacterized protein n=1 Tax=Diaporthe vaccinii TaxID=105482 RepID=A0ABR4EF16_9PEZI